MIDKQRRSAYAGLDDTLETLVSDSPIGETQGNRGKRKRPRYPSESRRERLHLDTDLEPAVAEVLRILAQNQQGLYGQGPIRLADLGTVALMLGLLEIANGTADIEALWTYKSRGSRSITLGQDFEALWGTLIRRLEIDRSQLR